MSAILRLIDKNHPLHAHETFVDSGGWHGNMKSPEKYAKAIFNALSHPDAVTFIAREFPSLSMQVRIELRTLCNSGNSTGNVRKGVQRLNQLLRGELLREEQRVHVNIRVETQHGVGYRQKVVNPAVAGAARKYGAPPRGR